MAVLLIVLSSLLASKSVYADLTKEDAQANINQLQERLHQLNDEISMTVVQQAEQEQAIQGLNKCMITQKQKLTEMIEKLGLLEKEIQARARAIQLKEADQKATFLHLDGWSKTLSTTKGIESVCKADDARAKEYTELVKKINKQQSDLEKKKQEYEAAQLLLQTTIEKQTSSKVQLEQELETNKDLLVQIQDKERQQELALKEKQEDLWQQVILGQSSSSNEEVGEKAQAIILTAKQYLGVPYMWGGATPNGFDCSGLMQWVFAQNGVSLPRVSQAQQAAAKEIPISDVQPGDLVFWGKPAYHVALYIGNGYFIQAPQPGEVVKITHSSYYPFESAGRILF